MEINHIALLRKLDRAVLRLKAGLFGQPLPNLKRLKVRERLAKKTCL